MTANHQSCAPGETLPKSSCGNRAGTCRVILELWYTYSRIISSSHHGMAVLHQWSACGCFNEISAFCKKQRWWLSDPHLANLASQELVDGSDWQHRFDGSIWSKRLQHHLSALSRLIYSESKQGRSNGASRSFCISLNFIWDFVGLFVSAAYCAGYVFGSCADRLDHHLANHVYSGVWLALHTYACLAS